MFLNRDETITALEELVGFDQTSDPQYPTLLPSLVTSRSSKIVNREHPLLQIENIDQSLTNFSQFEYTAYSGTTEYQLGAKVSLSGANYEYINPTPSTGNTPPNTTYWKVIDELSDALIKIRRQGISEAIDAILDSKKARKRVKSIYENVLLYDGLANYRDEIDNNNDFVGLRIRLKKDRSLITVLNRIGTQFTEVATGNLTMSLYHSSQNQRIATFTITPGVKNSSKWTTLSGNDRIIRYLSDNYDAGGDFYLGYKQSDLEALGTNALNMDIKNLLNCRCSDNTIRYYHNYSQYVDIIGFRIAESEMTGDELFDPYRIQYTPNINYGINLDMDAKCDIGPFIVKQEDSLAQVVNLSVARVMMRNIANNTRGGNALSNQTRQLAKDELFEFNNAKGTLVDRLNKAIVSTSFDFSGLNGDCLPSEDLSVTIGADEFNLFGP